eukprot:c25992_g1_i1 orf=382-546(-)
MQSWKICMSPNKTAQIVGLLYLIEVQSTKIKNLNDILCIVGVQCQIITVSRSLV